MPEIRKTKADLDDDYTILNVQNANDDFEKVGDVVTPFSFRSPASFLTKIRNQPKIVAQNDKVEAIIQ